MAIYQINCKEKHSLYERVVSIGCAEVGTGSLVRFTEDEAINRIEKGTDSFYVERPEGHRVWVIVAQREGRKYLKTETDGEKPDNLLSLPECPAKKTEPFGTKRSVIAAPSHGTNSFFSECWGA
jgi:hypothetical protein